jgi:hypothetical protein
MEIHWVTGGRTILAKRGIAFAIVALICGGLTARRVAAAPAAEPCAMNASARQLDFWVGDWKISDGENPATATSKVSLELGKCLVAENWSDPAGNRGENFFGYNLDDKTWGGMFADTRGQVHIFVRGTVANGKAVFYGPSRGPHGTPMLNRITIVRLGPGKVEQTWEKSGDNGATWQIEFRGEYLRAK